VLYVDLDLHHGDGRNDVIHKSEGDDIARALRCHKDFNAFLKRHTQNVHIHTVTCNLPRGTNLRNNSVLSPESLTPNLDLL